MHINSGDPQEFKGKSVLVTGAGKGIGRAVAIMLASREAHIVALSRSQADLDSLAAEIGSRGIAVDLGDADATRKAVLEALPVDYLVNCAGTTAIDSFLDVSVEAFDMLHAVNTRAPMIIAQEYARDRLARGMSGAIVNVSSVASFIGFADHAAYCASKGGLDALSRVMANELGRKGIRTNVVNPIITMTPMATKVWSDPQKSAPMMARVPVQHFAAPEEVAEVILFLLSDRASMINGIAMPVDGGFMIN